MDYYELLYGNGFDDLDEMNIFLKKIQSIERYKISKLTQEKIENLNSPESFEEIELIFRNLPTKKTPGHK